MADDQGWGDVAYNGHPVLKTPHLDEMAASGLRFDRFYAAAPVCSPTRGSVMTGRHPNRFGCFTWGHTLRPQETTIAEALKTAGYATGHFGKWHLGSVRKGSPVNPGSSGFDEWFSAPNFFDNDPILSDQGKAVQTEGESSLVTVEAALEFISRSVSENNFFFAVVWFGSPHGPHLALQQDRLLYPDEEEPLQHFYGEITAMDRAIGKLRSGLRELGIQDNTLLWYCSDNGAITSVGSTGGYRGKKGDIYEGGLMVPAILEWPKRIPSPKTTSTRANTSDIFPTLMEVAGIALDGERMLDGISLLPVLEGAIDSRPKPMGFWEYPESGVRTPSSEWMAELLAAQTEGREPEDKWKLRLDAGEIKEIYGEDLLPGHAAWVDGDWKLHRIADKSGEQFRLELYDLAKDPGEEVDLKEGEPERTERMVRSLEVWQRSVIRSLNGEDYR
jgi:arylsulfatase A-like enzyme